MKNSPRNSDFVSKYCIQTTVLYQTIMHYFSQGSLSQIQCACCLLMYEIPRHLQYIQEDLLGTLGTLT